MQIKQIIDVIDKHNKFLVSSHINMEGDALCSQLAMQQLLRNLKKEVQIMDSDPVPEHFMFLPHAGDVSNDLDKAMDFEVALVLDCPNLKRIGRVQELVTPDKFIVNIDHHISNESFGRINWVDPQASSVGEMLYAFYREAKVEISKDVALYLYIAILTDTGSFNYDNTSPATHEIAARLLALGIKPGQVAEKIYEQRTLADIRLLTLILSSLKLNQTQEVAYMDITRKMLAETGADITKTDNAVNYARSIDTVKVAIIFREGIGGKDGVGISLRSKGDVDVNKIASFFGGGGHKKAAGCLVKGKLEDVKRRILDKAEELLKLQKS